MSINYRLYKVSDNLNGADSKCENLYPRIITTRTVGLEELCQKAAYGSTYNAHELQGAVKLLIDQMKKELGDSNNVCIEGFGTFSITAEAVRDTEDPHGIRAESIRLKRIVFRTSKSILKGWMPVFKKK
jgi:predicted histone-like DNA-binding protein